MLKFLLVSIFVASAEGQTATIQTQEEVWAAAGADADLSCQLLGDEDVDQVSWMKKSTDKEEYVGSCSRLMGENVNPDFSDKVKFKEAGLKISSIVIRKVSEQDEGCYFCKFILHPSGVPTARTCLHVYELHGPILHIRELWSPEESEVSCSATGRPAPTVTLIVTQHLGFSQHNTTRVHNNNNTVTVTTTAVLSGYHGNSTQVGCVVGVASGAQIQVLQRIYEKKRTSDDGFLNPESLSSFWAAVLVMTALFCMLAGIGYLQHKHSSRNPERTKTPQQTTRDSQQATTPLIHHVNEIRQRTPAKTRPESSVSKQLFKDVGSS